jgi:hypothetical protein
MSHTIVPSQKLVLLHESILTVNGKKVLRLDQIDNFLLFSAVRVAR